MLSTITWLFGFVGLLAQAAPQPAFPRDGARQIIDNERVVVWEVVLPAGKPTQLHRHERDLVAVYPTGGTIKVTRSDGTSMTTVRKAGEAMAQPKGAIHIEEGLSSGEAVRAVVIELKDHTVMPLANKSGYPNAFPDRPGVKKVLETDRVLAWDYTWTPDVPTPVHFHDKDVVVVFLENGTLRSTTPDGQQTFNELTIGKTQFNARNRTHAEELVKGKARALIVELK